MDDNFMTQGEIDHAHDEDTKAQALVLHGMNALNGLETPKPRRGRKAGGDNTRSKQPSAIAQAFKKAGLDWKEDFALAIKSNNRARIKLWLRLLPYMVTSQGRTRVKHWKGRASRAALIALEAMEDRPQRESK